MTNIIIGPVRAGRQTTCVICKEQIRYGNPNRFGTGQRILPVALVNQNGSPKPGKPMIWVHWKCAVDKVYEPNQTFKSPRHPENDWDAYYDS